MRAFIFGLLAASVAVSACNRSDTPASAPGAAVAAGGSGSTDSAREITIPAGTQLPMVLETSVGSDTSRPEQPVQARLARPIVVGGLTALPEGSRVSGVVTDAKESGRVKGRAHIALRFDAVVPQGDEARYAMRTSAVGRTAPGTKKKDALEIGGSAAGGALIGGLLGGKKGAVIGTGVGGGAGTAYVLSTKGQEVHLNKGAAITVQLVQPLTVKVRG